MMKKPRSLQVAELVNEGAFVEPCFLTEKNFGEEKNDKIWLFAEEAFFLLEKGYIYFEEGEKKVRRHFSKYNSKFLKRYAVYKDLRNRGMIVKAGAKYGADFRVYEKGAKPSREQNREHSKYLVWVFGQDESLDSKTLLGINRVAHSVKKRLLLAIVDKELDVTFLQNTRVTF